LLKREITIIGGGAIGGIIAAYLTRAGLDVTVADQWHEHVTVACESMVIDGCRGDLAVPIRAVTPEDLHKPLDIVFLAVKSGDTSKALKLIVPLLKAGSIIVTLQNSINEDIIASAVGRQRTMGCVVGWGATFVKAGHLTQTSTGSFVLGNLEPGREKALETVRDILSIVSDCHITDNIYGFRWTKLLANASIATATLLGETIGDALAKESMPSVVRSVIFEGLAVSAKKGVRLETLDQKFTPREYIALREFIAESIIELLKTKHRNIIPAFYVDICKGLKSEIDYINGYIVARGCELKVPTPVNEIVVKMIHEIEDSKRTVGLKNIEQIKALIL
jgi:2-dehydropantoate 2-reductase